MMKDDNTSAQGMVSGQTEGQVMLEKVTAMAREAGENDGSPGADIALKLLDLAITAAEVSIIMEEIVQDMEDDIRALFYR